MHCACISRIDWQIIKKLPKKTIFILETAVRNDKVMQDFELESLPIGGDHSQKVKATPIGSDYGSKDCVTLSSPTAVSRFIHIFCWTTGSLP